MGNVGRNAPCPCRSGKKYKRCCIGKSPRDDYMYIGHREPYQGVTLKDGQVFVHTLSGQMVKADATFTQRQYKRRSGKDKILVQIPNGVSPDIHSALASGFKVIWAIDTNTKQIGGELVSVSSIFECFPRTISPQRVQIRFRKSVNIFFKGCQPSDAEKHGWWKLVSAVMKHPKHRKDLRFGILTDHDLSNHSAYNAGTKPIYRGLRLPGNIRFLYASSDGGNGNFWSMLMRKCDRDSAGMLRKLEVGGSATVGNSTVSLGSIPDV